MNAKSLLVVLAIAAICAIAYFGLKLPGKKPEISEISGEIEIPEAEIGAPTFEEEPTPLDLGSLI